MPAMQSYERGQRQYDGQDVRSESFYETPGQALYGSVRRNRAGAARSPGFVGTTSVDRAFFDPLIDTPAITPPSAPEAEEPAAIDAPMATVSADPNVSGISPGVAPEAATATVSADPPTDGPVGVNDGPTGIGDSVDSDSSAGIGAGVSGSANASSGVSASGTADAGVGVSSDVSGTADASGGGGGGDGGTVICTHLRDRGLMPRELYRLAHLNGPGVTVQRGYHFWAVPMVRLMRRSRVAECTLMYIVVHWARAMAHRHSPTLYPQPCYFGTALDAIGRPLCWLIGLFAPPTDWQALYEGDRHGNAAEHASGPSAGSDATAPDAIAEHHLTEAVYVGGAWRAPGWPGSRWG